MAKVKNHYLCNLSQNERKYAATGVNYAKKSFEMLKPVAKVKNIFQCNLCHYQHNLSRNLKKYAARCVNYTQKSFMTLTPVGNVKKLFSV